MKSTVLSVLCTLTMIRRPGVYTTAAEKPATAKSGEPTMTDAPLSSNLRTGLLRKGEPVSEQTKAFLRWVKGICVDDSRTHYRRIQAIMRVIYYYEEPDDKRPGVETTGEPK